MGRNLVARVLGPAQHAEDVLHVGRLQELEPAVLHERHVAPGELELERVAVVGRAHEDGLAPERDARLPVREHAACHEVHLRALVGGRDQTRALLREPSREQPLAIALG